MAYKGKNNNFIQQKVMYNGVFNAQGILNGVQEAQKFLNTLNLPDNLARSLQKQSINITQTVNEVSRQIQKGFSSSTELKTFESKIKSLDIILKKFNIDVNSIGIDIKKINITAEQENKIKSFTEKIGKIREVTTEAKKELQNLLSQFNINSNAGLSKKELGQLSDIIQTSRTVEELQQNISELQNEVLQRLGHTTEKELEYKKAVEETNKALEKRNAEISGNVSADYTSIKTKAQEYLKNISKSEQIQNSTSKYSALLKLSQLNGFDIKSLQQSQVESIKYIRRRGKTEKYSALSGFSDNEIKELTRVAKGKYNNGKALTNDQFVKYLEQQVAPFNKELSELQTAIGNAAKYIQDVIGGKVTPETARKLITGEGRKSFTANRTSYYTSRKDYQEASREQKKVSKKYDEYTSSERDIKGFFGNVKKEVNSNGNIGTVTTALKENIEKEKEAQEDFTEFKESIVRDSEEVRSNVASNLNSASNNFDNMQGGIERCDRQLDEFAKQTQKLEQFKQRLTYLVSATSIFYGLRRAIMSTKDTILELDEAFNDIAVVTNFTNQQLWNSFGTYNKMAQKLGVTTSDAIKTSALWYQQGIPSFL